MKINIPKEPVQPESFANIEEKIGHAVNELNYAIWKYQPHMVVGLMSGGNDSLPACYIASLSRKFDGILHINTGIGIEDTRVFVRELCAEQKWKLWEYKATENVKADGTPDPMIYEDLCIQHGFPGAFGHRMMYSKLKERQLRRFKRDNGISGVGKNKKRVMLVNGVRKSESKRRMGTVSTDLLQVRGGEFWAAPIRFWDKQDCRAARIYAGLRENPVAFNIHKSGECLCGAFAKKGELAELEFFYPEAAKRIKDLEVRVRAAGHDWGWEDQAKKKLKPSDQLELTAIEEQFLCTKCNIENPADMQTTITIK